ncbi:MAG: aldo/keto reductase [Cyanobacteriota bacterium]
MNTDIEYRPLSNTGYYISPVGFGSYRIDARTQKHRVALEKALLSGINLIDTSANYTDGNSELLIGSVVNDLIDSNQLKRESIVIVTKGGYLQGENYFISQIKKNNGNPFPELVEYTDGLEHCIHPEFLEDQISRSLERLNLNFIDIYLLHNPEYYLNHSKNVNLDRQIAQQEYYRRIEQAFRFLESEVTKGRIKYYGISSNSFPDDSNQYMFTSLERIINIAKNISINNHFKVIQLPMNLIETGAILNNNQSGNLSVIELAYKSNIAILINRPLNSYINNKLIRLAEPGPGKNHSENDILKSIEILLNREKKLFEINHFKTSLNDLTIAELAEKISFSDQLMFNWKNFAGYEHWKNALLQYFSPRLGYFKTVIYETENLPDEILCITNDFIASAEESIKLISEYYKYKDFIRVTEIKDALFKINNNMAKNKTLSQIALRAIYATTGITSVLTGMRNESYVEDILDELKDTLTFELNKDTWNEIDHILKTLINE